MATIDNELFLNNDFIEISYLNMHYSGFKVLSYPQNLSVYNEFLPVAAIPVADNPNVVWYYDKNYSIPVIAGEDFTPYFRVGYQGPSYVAGSMEMWGRIEMPVIKVLDTNGVKALFDLLSLQDYPNNDVLMAVINAIDTTKLDKNKMFIGTLEEYNVARTRGDVQDGAIVILTDVD